MLARLGAIMLCCGFMVACERVPPEHIEVVISDGQNPVAGVEVRAGDALLGATDAKGKLVVSDVRSLGEKVTFQVRHPDPLSPFLSQAQTVDLPWAYFPDDVRVSLVLARIPTKESQLSSVLATPSRAAPADDAKTVAQPRAVDDPQPRTLAESELAPEPTKTPVVTPAPMMGQEPVQRPLEPVVTLGPILIATPHVSAASTETPKEISVHVFVSGKPLSEAQVFVTDTTTRTLTQIGVTGTDGVLKAPSPVGIKPEGLLIRHRCCKPLLRPVMAGSSAPAMIVMSAEKGRDFVLMRDFFGFARTFPSTELWSANARVDLATESGVLIGDATQFSKSEFSLVNREAIPEKYQGKLEDNESSAKPIVVYAGSRKAPLPLVGLVEFQPEGEQATKLGEGKWRRFRREVFSRFVQASALRSVIPGDVLILSDAAKLKPRELVERGWEFTVVNPALDFILVLAGTDPKSVSVRLVDRSGSVLWEKDALLDDTTAPEKRGAEIFSEFLERFPFEGSVTAFADGVATVNLGNDLDRGLKKGQKLEFFGHANNDRKSRLSERVGLGEVLEIERNGARVRVIESKGELKADYWIGLRAKRQIVSK